ncbi:phospholipid-transporting ATPase 1-like protein, partial [Tanacetum coccineum]
IMIPIDLYISMELVRVSQVFFMIRDDSMYDESTESRFKCRALNMNEDLGQVKYVFLMKQTDLSMLGASGSEDKLQQGVPEAIDSLRLANMKVWVLIGDQQETAISIRYSSKLLTSNMKPTEVAQLATKGVLGEVVTTCERSQVRVSPWGFSFMVGMALPHRCVESRLAGTTFWVCTVESNH